MRTLSRLGLMGLMLSAAGLVHAADPAPLTPSEAEAVAQLQVLQAYIGEGKRAFVGEQLVLTDAEAARFWPVFDEYQGAVASLNRRRLDNIMAYARVWNADSMDDASAKALAKEAIAIEKDEVAALDRAFKKLARAIPAAKAVRYLQLEYKLRAIVRFEQAANVPFAPSR